KFDDKTVAEKAFVEDLWARRKVGFLLDQIRVQGENKEVVDEVIQLAKRYGITTPYTSYLLVPDGTPGPAIGTGPRPKGAGKGGPGGPVPQALGGFGGGSANAPAVPPLKLEEFAKRLDKDVAAGRVQQEDERIREKAKK